MQAPTASFHLTDNTSCDISVERVSQGGFATVFMGPDHLHGYKWYVLKTPRSELVERLPRLRKVFIREALLWVGLWPHANILTAHTVIEINKQPFLIEDYAEYGTLRDLLISAKQEPRGRLPLKLGLVLAQHIAAALVVLHTPDPLDLRGSPLVHRDLKPENIAINSHGVAQVFDFGTTKATLADLMESGSFFREDVRESVDVERNDGDDAFGSLEIQTRSGVAMGTYAYMPPEQWYDAASVGPPGDMFTFGIILSELIAGRHAFLDLEKPHTQQEWRQAHISSAPRSLREIDHDVPAELEALYRACLIEQPELRPTAAGALAILQKAARSVGCDVYNPPEVYARTAEHELARWHNLSIAYYSFEYYEEALERNSRALALSPKNWQILTTRGNILDSLGKGEEALGSYNAALANMPDDDVLAHKAIWSNKGVCLSMLDRFEEADQTFQQALDVLPRSADVCLLRALNLRHWGVTQYQSGDMTGAKQSIDQAIHYAEQALRLDPRASDPRRLLVTLQHFLDVQLDGV